MKTENSNQHDAGRNVGAVRDWLLRLVLRAWPALLILLILGLAWVFIWCLSWGAESATSDISEWLGNIEDPTERGCAYIAIAIGAHALVMIFKTFSHDEIKVKELPSQNNED